MTIVGESAESFLSLDCFISDSIICISNLTHFRQISFLVTIEAVRQGSSNLSTASFVRDILPFLLDGKTYYSKSILKTNEV